MTAQERGAYPTSDAEISTAANPDYESPWHESVARALSLLDQYDEFDCDPRNVYGVSLARQRTKTLRNVLLGADR